MSTPNQPHQKPPQNSKQGDAHLAPSQPHADTPQNSKQSGTRHVPNRPHPTPLQHSKQNAARYAVESFIQDKQRIGLGTGSTVEFVLQALQGAITNNLLPHASFFSSSTRTTERCTQLGIPITDYSAEAQATKLDIVIDGADAVNESNQLIKGGGGALLREKVLAYNSMRLIIVVDHTKLVPSFGPTTFPLPIEAVPYATHSVINHLLSLHISNAPLFASAALRTLSTGTPFITDNQNHIIDAHFAGTVDDVTPLEPLLNNIVGVVENGLFTNARPTVVCANGTEIMVR